MSVKNEFPPEWKQGLYEAITRRRDMRSFLPDPIPNDVLARVLNAAHHAGSVGFMQPWNFVLVENLDTRRKLRAHVEIERLRAAEKFDAERKEKYLTLKLEGILEAPLNICVTCDPTRFGPAVLGRNTIRETDIFSTCCAIQNLWLAARAEGLGVGWVSILEPAYLRELLGMPPHILPVGYLCIGYVKSFPDKPTLQTQGWLPRTALADLVFADRWGEKTSAGMSESLSKMESESDL